MFSSLCISVVFLISLTDARPNKLYSRWRFRNVIDTRRSFRDPFQNEKLSLGPVEIRPVRGQTGFPKAEEDLGLNLNIPTLATPVMKEFRGSIVKSITRTPKSAARRSRQRVASRKPAPKRSNTISAAQQRLRFRDPTNGKSLQITYTPILNTEPTYPTPTRVFDLEDTHTFPSTYEKGKPLPFDRPNQNTYMHDEAFYNKLNTKKENTISRWLGRSKSQSPLKNTRDNFWQSLLFVLLNK